MEIFAWLIFWNISTLGIRQFISDSMLEITNIKIRFIL